MTGYPVVTSIQVSFLVMLISAPETDGWGGGGGGGIK